MISVNMFMYVELVAAAVLALWVVARYPGFGPKALRPAFIAVGAAFVVLRLCTFGAVVLVGLPNGVYLALFGCILPSFFAGFLAAAWLLRAFAGSLGGSGGGGGHRVSAPARS